MWITPALSGTVLILVALLASYAFVKRPTPWRFLLGSCKLVAVALIALCLVNPLWSRAHPKPGENIVVLLADNSQSLSIQDSEMATRGDQLSVELKNPDANWQVRLGQEFDVRKFLCGERLLACEDFVALDHSEHDSRLLAAVQGTSDRFRQLPLAAIVLFTDGNAADADLLESIPANVPIFPVLPTSNADLSDLSLVQVSINESPFEDAPFTIQVTVQAHGPVPDGGIEAWIEPVAQPSSPASTEQVDSADSPLRLSQHVSLDSSGRGLVKFDVAPVEIGTLFYRIRVAPTGQEGVFDGAVPSTELTLVNNERLITLQRRARPRRILYVSGRPNWEHKFLNRALVEDRQVELVSLIRIARKEAKFDFRGRAGDNSNSLFRGFKNEADEETEAYNQPVLIRLNTKDEDELRDGFPKTRAELFEYAAIILDDVEGEFFTRDQQQLIDRFVSERGGGLLMLGGIETFRQGEWNKTSVRDALPIYLDRPGNKPASHVRLKLTRDGWLQPWVRLRTTENEELQRLADMPAFHAVTALEQIKPAARIMAEVEDETGQAFPSLVVQSYGKGHAAALLVGDMWRWELLRPEIDTDDLGRAWRQTLRWLVSETPDRSSITAEAVAGGPEATTIQVRLHNKEYEPLENAGVTLDVVTPSGETIPYNAEPALSEPGLFEVTVMSREPGPYRVTSTAVVGDQEEILTSATGWVSDPLAREFSSTSINRDLMQQLAERTGGRIMAVNELPEFVNALQKRDLPVMEVEISPLWHSPWLLTIAIVLLLTEWGLRRMKGLT